MASSPTWRASASFTLTSSVVTSQRAAISVASISFFSATFRRLGTLRGPSISGFERGVGLERPQQRLVLGVEPGDELLGRHAATPSRSSVGSSCVSVSLVTTRPQRACHGWLWRASACVVKPSTGHPAASTVSKTRA